MSANAVNMGQSKILLFGKELKGIQCIAYALYQASHQMIVFP